MVLTQRLDLRQTQALVMTPQLQQAIKLLQFSNLELNEFIEGELETNPLLDRDEASDGAPEAPPAQETSGDGENLAAEGSEGDGRLDFGGDPAAWQSAKPRPGPTEELPGLDQTLSRPKTLREHLLEQLALDITDPADRVIGAELVELVEEAGYVAGELGELALRLSCSIERVEAVLTRLQHFDPPGICARTLKECLALQLRDRDRLDPAMQTLLDHLPLLASRDAAGLMRLCGVDAEDLAEMVAEIKALNPKPGLAFDTALAIPVIPEVLLRTLPDGNWAVELNADTLPRVLVNRRYYAEIGGKGRGKAERDYIAERLQQANWLVKALDQRATTILKVAREIVRQQEGFFRHGVQHLKPLVLRDIAAEIGMHESTVSRVTSNKYLASPRGIFELKYFFTASVASATGGDAVSAEAVRFRIKALIDTERDTALSDDRLVELLRRDGVAIARRTVAKYREAMHIPSSVQRRRDQSLFV
ncbi:MAG TPA: RNA polymerase factor sigma-54 [Stellaceae bacterium]|jgi:RNA polymerase sigma-54 factor|nr:RNA polymerase factor sigma-54 [Stellaceae bacterium]